MQSTYQVKRISGPDVASAVHAYFDLYTENVAASLVTYFAFDGARPGPGRVMVCTRDGEDHREVGRAPYGSANGGAEQQWASNDEIVYRLAEGDEASTALASVRTGAHRILPTAVRMCHPETGLALSHSLSVPGMERGEEAVYLLDLKTERARPLFSREEAIAIHPLRDQIMAMTPADRANLEFKHTKWSPDGSMFFAVFHNVTWYRTYGRGVYIKSLFLANADGSAFRYLSEFGHHPLWLPDSSAVHTFERHEDGSQAMLAHPVDGREPYVIFEQAPGVHPSFSPDGKLVVTDRFRYPQPGWGQVLLYDVATKEPEVLATFATPDTTHETGVHPHPVWSRDGKRVYFAMAEENVPGLYAIDL